MVYRSFDLSLRVIGSWADRYIVAGLMSYHSTLQIDGLMGSRPTSDIGARSQRHQANHCNRQEWSAVGGDFDYLLSFHATIVY